MIVVTVLPAVLAGSGGGARHIGLLDEGSGSLADRLVTQLETGNQFRVDRVTTSESGAPAAMEELTERVQAKSLDGFLVVSGATLESGKLEYRGQNVSSHPGHGAAAVGGAPGGDDGAAHPARGGPGRGAGVPGAHLAQHAADQQAGGDGGDGRGHLLPRLRDRLRHVHGDLPLQRERDAQRAGGEADADHRGAGLQPPPVPAAARQGGGGGRAWGWCRWASGGWRPPP